MRLPSFLLVLVVALAGRLSAQINNDPITTVGTIPDKTIKATLGSSPVDLSPYFAVPSITGEVVQFTTTGVGTFNVEMNATAAPNTVANFLSYVNANRFTNSFMHRSDPGVGIIQGGTFLASIDANGIPLSVTPFPAINLETSDTLPNSVGTIAMARKGNDLNSATSGWFINVTDNSIGLPPASAGGYAVFGRVTGTGLTVVNALAALPVLGGRVTVTNSSTGTAVVAIDSATAPSNFGVGWILLGSEVQSVNGNIVTLAANANATIGTNTSVPYTLFSSTNSAPFNEFTQLPVLTNLPNADAPLVLSNLVTQSSIRKVPIFPTAAGTPSVVTFSAASSNPGLVSATVSGSNLVVTAAKNLNGTSQVTVTATDSNGNAVSQTAFTVTVQKQAVDFNGDTNADILFQNAIGQVVTWHMNGAGIRSSWAYLSTGALGDWRAVGKGDFNGDGNTDILYQNNAGQIAVWYMNGAGVRTSWANLSTAALGDWKVVGTGDFNSDGNLDILFQNTIGQTVVWHLNGAGVRTSWAYLSTDAVGDWRAVATGDFNSDGNTDILLQNNAGQVVVWYLNGAGIRTSWAYLSTDAVGDWRVVGTGDFNNDGNNDILLQNAAGYVVVWHLNGSGVRTSWAWISTAALGDWRVR